MTPSNVLTNPTVSIFINGTPVANGDMLQVLSDVNHVEVLKGPQSAYFGRETFAGAVNVVTNAPTNHLTGDLSLEAGSRNTYVVTGDLSGPLIQDKVMMTVGGKYDTHSGSYQNAMNPSQTLGDQSTREFHVALTIKPFENLTLKAFTMALQDRDGPAATGVYLASAPNAAYSQGNCTLAGSPFFCGTLPAPSNVTPSQNVNIPPGLAAFLASPHGTIRDSSAIQGFGLKRDASHTDFTAEYVVPNLGLTFTNLFGYNWDQWSALDDLSVVDSLPNGNIPGYFNQPYGGFDFEVQDININLSEEFRIATDTTKPYRALVGFSYIDTHMNQALGGAAPLNPGPSQSTTKGVFFSLAWDIIPQITINFDGRYQQDYEAAYGPTYATIASGTSTNFLPRVSAQYRFTPDIMAYFTYSQGANPGVFNTQYGNIPAVSQAEIKAAGYNVGVATQPELVTNYEIGFKGKFLDGRATLAADVYYDQWTNQLNSVTYVFGLADLANPINVKDSIYYNAIQKAVDPIAFTSNAAASTPKGVEVEGNLIPVDHVTLNASAAYNDTRYTSFICGGCAPLPATYNAAGKYLPFAPLFSSAVGAQYANTIHAFTRPMDWFARVDWIYRDGTYIQASNTVKTPNLNFVNLRGGITLAKGFTLEGWINNLTNEKSPVSGFQAYDFANFSNTAIDVTLPELITGGVTLRFKYN
jgi:iron complex outermembrane receptor protein